MILLIVSRWLLILGLYCLHGWDWIFSLWSSFVLGRIMGEGGQERDEL